MSSDFRELLGRAGKYEFDPKKLDAIPITGILRKSPDPKKCILVIASEATGDLVVEIEADDVVKHEVKKGGEPAEDQVTLHVKPTAMLNHKLQGKDNQLPHPCVHRNLCIWSGSQRTDSFGSVEGDCYSVFQAGCHAESPG
jgi:hypothetical protein